MLQPRVAIGAVSAASTTFSLVFSGHVGLDPYTTAVSDVYQDLFGEGSYVGKGIYDVDAFERALSDRVPDNALLSHDLFEGLFARVALCTDLEVIDDFPSHYLTWVARLHRWVRGDWQLLPWLWRTVPTQSGARVRNALPAVSRWKIADNLRRSLLPLALIVLLTAGWLVLPGGPSLWTGTAFLVLFFPAYVQWGQTFANRVRGVRLRDHLRSERDNLASSLHQVLLHSAFLAHQSVVMVDAIGRTLVRLRHEAASARVGDRRRHGRAASGRMAAGAAADVDRAGRWRSSLAARRALRCSRRAPCGRCRCSTLWAISPYFAYHTGCRGKATGRCSSARERRELRQHRAADVAVLRGGRHARATTGWCPTTIRRTGPTRSRTARRRPTSACR